MVKIVHTCSANEATGCDPSRICDFVLLSLHVKGVPTVVSVTEHPELHVLKIPLVSSIVSSTSSSPGLSTSSTLQCPNAPLVFSLCKHVQQLYDIDDVLLFPIVNTNMTHVLAMLAFSKSKGVHYILPLCVPILLNAFDLRLSKYDLCLRGTKQVENQISKYRSGRAKDLMYW